MEPNEEDPTYNQHLKNFWLFTYDQSGPYGVIGSFTGQGADWNKHVQEVTLPKDTWIFVA